MSTPASELSSLLTSYLDYISSYRDYAIDVLSHHARIQDTARFISAKLAGFEGNYNSIDQEPAPSLPSTSHFQPLWIFQRSL